MKKNCAKHDKPRAFTLIEIMSAILVLTIIILGASLFRYTAALDSRKAYLQKVSAQITLLLCESWHSVDGVETFDPAEEFGSVLAITPMGVGPDAPTGNNTLSRYEIVIDNIYYWSTLSWKDISPGLRALNVITTWHQQGSGGDSPGQANKSFNLTTYVTY